MLSQTQYLVSISHHQIARSPASEVSLTYRSVAGHIRPLLDPQTRSPQGKENRIAPRESNTPAPTSQPKALRHSHSPLGVFDDSPSYDRTTNIQPGRGQKILNLASRLRIVQTACFVDVAVHHFVDLEPCLEPQTYLLNSCRKRGPPALASSLRDRRSPGD